MVWKKDLAKLKQDLKAEESLTPPKPVPVKRAPKPDRPLDIEGEDAMFLAAMGKRPARVPSSIPLEEPKAPSAVAVSEPVKEESFLDAMGSLKGVKRLAEVLPSESPKIQAPEPAKESQPEVPAKTLELELAPVVAAVSSESAPEEPRLGPIQMHLAAGMAIEVDGSLDLRGHSAQDAIERLKERILDGQALGWRTLHAFLGSAELAAAFQEFLKCAEAQQIVRYAQAPVPMGGNQAWILYLAPLTGRENG